METSDWYWLASMTLCVLGWAAVMVILHHIAK